MKNKICASCSYNISELANATFFNKIFINNNDKMANWAAKAEFIEHAPPLAYDILHKYHNKQEIDNKHGNKHKLDLGLKMANRWIFLWASKYTHNPSIMLDALEAYDLDKNPNFIFKKLDHKGRVGFKISPPQLYRAPSFNKEFPIHLHFKISNKNGTKFLKRSYTQTYLPMLNLKQVLKIIKNKNYIIIDALPEQYYSLYKLPNSVNLSYKKCPKLDKKSLDKFIEQALINYPNIENLVKNKKLKLTNVPILVYCAKSSCEASHILANCLLKLGYLNIYKYKNGTKEFYKKILNIDIF